MRSSIGRMMNKPEQLSKPRRASRNTYLAIATCYLAFALRLFALDAQPLWWDEAISLHLARSSLMDIVVNRAGNLHPPLYFLLLKVWVFLGGDSPFSARFFSAFFSTLMIPAIYVSGHTWLNQRAGLIAAALAAVSPLYIYYAQEARVYALLPLLYLVLLTIERRISLPGSQPDWRLWLLLAGSQIVALGLHYMSLFAIAHVLAKLVVSIRQRRAALTKLAMAQGVVILLLLPWFLIVLRYSDGLSTRLRMSNWQAEPVTLVHFARLLWTFQMTGLTSLISDPNAIALTSAAALAMAGTTTWLFVSARSRRPATALLLDWLIPLTSAFIVWYVRPLSHPRYAIFFTPPLLLLIAYGLEQLLVRSLFKCIMGTLLAISLVTTSVLALFTYHTRFRKDDTRTTAAAISARSTPTDLVLVPPEDWSVPYYYTGPAPVEMIWAGDAPADWQRIAELTDRTETVFLVDYHRATRDPRAILPFALESAGSLSNRWTFKGLYVQVYQMNQSIAPPDLTPLDARFGPLRLIAAWAEQDAPVDTAITCALRWQVEKPVHTPLRAGLRLGDADGWIWASADDWLLNQAGDPTDRWTQGSEVTTYHLLPLSPGAPPLTYSLAVGIYRIDEGQIHPLDLLDEVGAPHGQSLDLGIASTTPPLGPATDPYGVDHMLVRWKTPVRMDEGLHLAGASLDRASVALGQPLWVTLHWTGADHPAYVEATLRLEQGGTVLLTMAGPVGGRYPTQHWTDGQTVVEHRRLVIPTTAGEGEANVSIQIGKQRVELGSVNIDAGSHLLQSPPMTHRLGIRFGEVAELVGYDLQVTTTTGDTVIRPDQPVIVTLYWRALENPTTTDYAVFTHILADDGHLVGQHDSPPAEGARPIPGWIPGEYIVDQHAMIFREPYVGPIHIAVGLYNPATMERVPMENGDTFALLPTVLIVQEPQDR